MGGIWHRRRPRSVRQSTRCNAHLPKSSAARCDEKLELAGEAAIGDSFCWPELDRRTLPLRVGTRSGRWRSSPMLARQLRADTLFQGHGEHCRTWLPACPPGDHSALLVLHANAGVDPVASIRDIWALRASLSADSSPRLRRRPALRPVNADGALVAPHMRSRDRSNFADLRSISTADVWNSYGRVESHLLVQAAIRHCNDDESAESSMLGLQPAAQRASADILRSRHRQRMHRSPEHSMRVGIAVSASSDPWNM